MRKQTKMFIVIVGLMLISSLDSLAQSSTVTVREAYTTPYGTTYWIDTYPDNSYGGYSMPTSAGTISIAPYSATPVRGDRVYEKFVSDILTLANKANKTPDENNRLYQYGLEAHIIFKRPKDERLRRFYKYYGGYVIKLHNIFGDKQAAFDEQY